MSSTQDPLET